MTLLGPAAGPPSRSAVRRSGDEFQDLVAWCAALRLCLPDTPFTHLEIEAPGAGNVDDVVLRSATEPDRYMQVKWTTNTAEAVTDDYLRARSGNGASILQKFHRSWQTLHDGAAPPWMELVTNRVLDRSDPLLGQCDGRTDLLRVASGPTPRAQHPGSGSQSGPPTLAPESMRLSGCSPPSASARAGRCRPRSSAPKR